MPTQHHRAKRAKALAESDERLNRNLKQLDDADKLDDAGTDDTVPTARVDKLEDKIAAIKERRARLDKHSVQLAASGGNWRRSEITDGPRYAGMMQSTLQAGQPARDADPLHECGV